MLSTFMSKKRRKKYKNLDEHKKENSLRNCVNPFSIVTYALCLADSPASPHQMLNNVVGALSPRWLNAPRLPINQGHVISPHFAVERLHFNIAAEWRYIRRAL